MRRNRNDTGLEAIRIEGGLLSSSLLTLLRHYKLFGQTPEEYGIEKGLKLNDELSRYWRIAQARWQQFSDLKKRADLDHDSVAKENWLIPLFTRVLDFQIEKSRPIHVGERTFPITHTAFKGSVPFVLTGPERSLEKGDPQFGEEGHKRSAAGLLQEYINAKDCCLWAIVSNGLTLRLLRDNPAMARPAYIEIDLERLFEEELYVDFTVFWLLLHASRLQPRDNSPENCILEQWRNQGQVDGERVLGELRHGVTNALRIMGTGFVAHPKNLELREAIKNEQLTTDQFFQELLRLIYRFLFLLTTEDRDILLDPAADKVCKKLYKKGYSISVLRDRSRFRRHYDNYGDGWQQLCITFAGFATGQPQLAQPALGGLFSADQCPQLEQAQLANRYLYDALFKLCYFESKGVLTRINYKDMDTEELGSVYESLLELIPQLNINGQWHFGFLGDEADDENATGHARKLTGSYYTPDSLVQELIKSTLEPVIEDRLEKNKSKPREALLGISVCDPACGSGHFLLAAARRLAAELARIEAGSDQPTEANYRHALREVVSHCIYGVDINPLAVELCRTALWLEAIEPGKPLGFLDAHIQMGNSLVGVLDPKLLQDGIPDAAFKPLSGDDWETAKIFLARNRVDPRQKELIYGHIPELAACVGDFAAMPEESLEQVEQKRDAWLSMVHGDACQDEKLLADLYTAAFFALKIPENAANVPTNVELAAPRRGETINLTLRRSIKNLAEEHRFFHWHLAFPEIFKKGGFDVLLGNPPWDVNQLSETEYFTSRMPSIAVLKGAKRKAAIESLNDTSPNVWENYQVTKRGIEAGNQFFRTSGRFPLTAVGKLNLYALFAELFLAAINKNGRAGVIVPSGIATDDSTKNFFSFLTRKKRLSSLYSFENEEFIFKAVHHSYRFCLLSISGSHLSPPAQFVFFARQPKQIFETQRRFELSQEDIQLINPNTSTSPVFRSQQDAELTKRLYRMAPVLIQEATENNPEKNPWQIRFSQGLFNMTSASHLFRTYDEIDNQGGVLLNTAQFELGSDLYLPLYEAKMVHHYDHRWATYELDGTNSRDCTLAEKQNPAYHNLPRYWVDSWQVTLCTSNAPKEILEAAKKEDLDELLAGLTLWAAGKALMDSDTQKAEELLKEPKKLFKETISGKSQTALQVVENWPLEEQEYKHLVEVLNKQVDPWFLTRQLLEKRRPKYLLGWRDITSAHVLRTVIAGIIPLAAVGNNMPLIFVEPKFYGKPVAALQANLCSLVFDFVARHKVGGTHLNFFIFKQLPVLPPDTYTEVDFSFIIPRVLELTYTNHALKPFAMELGFDGEPFFFDPKRRHQLKCELDAYFARLYSLTRDELRYILDPAEVMVEDYPSETFRVLKNKEINEFGEYRTQRLVLEAWDELSAAETLKKTAPVAEFSLYPETDGDRAICAIALALVQHTGGMGSMDHLDALILAVRPELCRIFLSKSDQHSFDTAMASAPKILWSDNRLNIHWKECRDHLEARKAIYIRHGLKDQPIEVGSEFSTVQASFPRHVEKIALVALNALAKVNELRKSRAAVTSEEAKSLSIFEDQHRAYQLVA